MLSLQLKSVSQPLPGPSSIFVQYTWNCVECPMKNHRGSAQCGTCGHKPGAHSRRRASLSVEESATSSSNASRGDIVSNDMGDSWGDKLQMDYRSNDLTAMDIDSAEDDLSQMEFDLNSDHKMYPFHRLDFGTMFNLVSCCLREWELLDCPEELVSLVAGYVLTSFEFESQRDRGGDVDLNDRTICRRTDLFIADDTWRNCFGSIPIRYNHFLRKFQWKLRCEGRGVAMIGFVEIKGASRCMGHHFAFYEDGYGVPISSNDEEIIVELHWLKTRTDLKCEFLLNGQKALELPPDKQYKFAVALQNRVEVTCVEYEECE